MSPAEWPAVHYSCEITVNLPRARFVELFDDPDNLKLWMKGLVSFTHLTGTPGQPGATSRLEFDTNGRKMVMTETVVVRNLPHEFGGTYETKGVFNSVLNRFEDVGGSQTRWVCETEFKLSGFLKVIGFLMPRAFKAQTLKFMNDFKAFAEGRGTN